MQFTGSIVIRILALSLDVFLLVVAFVFMFQLRFPGQSPNFLMTFGFWFSILIAILSLYIFGTYEFREEKGKSYYPFRITISIIFSASFVLIVHYLFGKDRGGFFGRGVFLGGSAVYLIFAMASRRLITNIVKKSYRGGSWIFILGDNDRPRIEKALDQKNFWGNSIFCSADSFLRRGDEILNKKNRLVVSSHEIRDKAEVADRLLKAKFAGSFVEELTSFYETQWQKIPYFHIDEEWILASKGFGIVGSKGRLRVKRIIDVFMAIILIVLTLPFILVTALIVRLESPGPIIFEQVRTGYQGREFRIYKFRSMVQNAEANGAQWASANDVRVTKVGRFIRKTRLDELPQLFNVLKGEMSFVGPRPERPEFNISLEKEIPFYNLRHLVLPGITGWAQVMYPYGASVDDAKEKLSYEIYYIKNHNLFFDFKIILRTVRIVLFGAGR